MSEVTTITASANLYIAIYDISQYPE